jgi:hypothetical protein
MTRVLPKLLLLALLTALVVAAGLGSADSAAPATEASGGDCVVANDLALHAQGRETAAGHFEHETWIAGPEAQEAVRALDAALRAEFGADGKTDPGATLAAGYVGTAVDHHAHELVVLVDAPLVSTQALEQRLNSAAAPLRVRVGKPCVAARDLVAAGATIRARSWHERADDVTFGYALDPHTSQFAVTFREADREVGEALARQLGEAVRIEYGQPSRRGRLDDGEPHWGGAGIGPFANGNDCSSGFTVRLSNGTLGSVTAGHCYNNGQNLWSGPQYYGLTAAESGYPTWDQIRIDPNGETFARSIHSDPCCPSSRTVTSRSNPAVSELVCVSGMVTRAVCGLQVTSTSASLCDADGCTTDLIRAEKPGSVVGQGGDSGAPMYTRPTTSTASIKGMEIGGTAADNVYAEKVTGIESHLGVTVVTS